MILEIIFREVIKTCCLTFKPVHARRPIQESIPHDSGLSDEILNRGFISICPWWWWYVKPEFTHSLSSASHIYKITLYTSKYQYSTCSLMMHVTYNSVESITVNLYNDLDKASKWCDENNMVMNAENKNKANDHLHNPKAVNNSRQ